MTRRRKAIFDEPRAIYIAVLSTAERSNSTTRRLALLNYLSIKQADNTMDHGLILDEEDRRAELSS